MDVDHDIGNFSQEDWDGICSTLSEPKAVSRDQWLQTIDALTAENSSLGLEKRSGEVSLKIAEENGAGATPLDSVAATSSSSISTGSSQANSLVSQQLRGNPARYVFEIAKKRYFEFSSEPPAKVNLVPSKFQKGVCCDFPPDYKCKSGAFPVITTCKSVPRDGFCGRCGSLGSHAMIHCQACCDPFHHFCAHLPKALVLRLTAWYCHRCAICSLCGGKEADGKSFVADVIETCYRCHKQFHIHCNSSSNFMLFNRNSEREITLCNCCFSRSSCRICRLPLSGSDYYRDFLDVSSAPCTVCRNAEERDMCRSCYSTKLSPDSSNDLRKVSCKRCCAVYHRKCVNFSGLDQQDFFCSKCSSAVHAAPKEVWTVTSGRVIIEKLRKLIMTVLNVEYRKRSSRLSMESQKYHELERHPAHESASIQSTLPRRSSKIVTVEQLVTSREHAVENSDPNSTFENSMVPVYGIYATIVNRIGDAHADEFWVGTSPDSGVPRCDSGASSFFSESNWPSFDYGLCDNNGTAFTDNANHLNKISVTFGEGLFGNTHAITMDPLMVLTRCSDMTSFKDMAERPIKMFDVSDLLKWVDLVNEDDVVCGHPIELLSRIRDILEHSQISLDSRCELLKQCEEWISSNPCVTAGTSTISPKKQCLLPVLRFFDPTNTRQFPSDRAVPVVDGRICMLCYIAGDDNCGIAGRILTIGYDLWAHIGCLLFVSHVKRCWDYIVLKLENVESQRSYWRTQCAGCPIRLGLVGCLNGRCPNSYHLNCAKNKECVILPKMMGVLCPSHKSSPIPPQDPRDKPPDFTTEAPVFARAPPTNVRSFASNAWNSGIRKEDVKLHFGATAVENLGRLVSGWDCKGSLLPCGYRSRRLFWSTSNPTKLAHYTCVILDSNSDRKLKSMICDILGMANLPDWGIDEQTYRDVEDEICEANLPLPGCSQLKFCEKSFEDFAGLGYALDEEDHENRFVSVDCSDDIIFMDLDGRSGRGISPVSLVKSDVPIPDALPVVTEEISADYPSSQNRCSVSPEIPLRDTALRFHEMESRYSAEKLELFFRKGRIIAKSRCEIPSSGRCKTVSVLPSSHNVLAAPPGRPSVNKKASKTDEHRSVMSHCRKPRTSRRKVRFSETVSEYPTRQDYCTHGAIAENLMIDYGPFCTPVEDPDPHPRLFRRVKEYGRNEMGNRQVRRVTLLLDYLEKCDLTKLSKSPSRLCLIAGDDGFLAAAYEPKDVVECLYARVREAQFGCGVYLSLPLGMQANSDPYEFFGLKHPATRYLLEQLPLPCNSFSPYCRKFFRRDVLRHRLKGDVEVARVAKTRFTRSPTCPTCPLPDHCFLMNDGRTFLKTPVKSRQVLFKWSIPCYLDSPEYVKVCEDRSVDLKDFPAFYGNIRQSRRGTSVMVYASDENKMIMHLALVSRKGLPVGAEIKYNPEKLPLLVSQVLYLKDFSCVKHKRK